MLSISGVFSVTFSVVFAYVADVTTEEDRSQAYGLVLVFFSSPEHEVLMVSYCDQSLSVVRPPSSVRCQLFPLNDFSSKTARRILK